MRQFNRKSFVAAMASAVATMGGAAGAFAAPEQTVEEIVITAQKREQKISEIPVAVQAFSSEQLESAGIRDLSELIYSVPGASEGRSTNTGTRSYQIRGMTSFYGDSTVGYFLDDAVFTILNRNWAPVARTFDVERVEVLRGPQGTLYGLGAMGGSVRFITADPDLKKFRARGGAGYSSTKGGDHNWTAEAAVSVPLSQDVAAIRVSASKEHRGGFAESPTFPGEKNETENETYRIKLLAKPNQDFTVKLGYQRSDDKDSKGNQLEYKPGTSPATEIFTGRYPVSTLLGAPVSTFNNTKTDVSSLYLSYDLGSVLVESSSGHIKAEASGRVPVNNLILHTGLDATTTSSELRLVSKGKGPLRWIAGVMMLDAESAEDVRLEAASPAPAIGLLGGRTYSPLRNDVPTYKSKSWAQFAEISYDLLDGRLTPLVGIRHFKDERTFKDIQRLHTKLPVGAPGACALPGFLFAPAGCLVPASVNSTSATFESWNPRFNLSYKPADGAMAYVNIAKGFRSGVFNSQQSVLLTGVSPTVAPDKVWSYELGGKLTLLDKKLTVEAAAYHLDWTNMQLNYNAPGFAPPPPQVIANAGDVKGDGLDYSVNWATPVRGLTVAATGNFNRTEFARIVNPLAFANTNIVKGKQLSTVPKRTLSLSANYRHGLPYESLTMSYYGSYTYIGEQGEPSSVGSGATTRPAPKGESQKLLNLRIGIEGAPWSAYLVGENLLNHSDPYYISGSGYQRNYPRTIGVEVKFDL